MTRTEALMKAAQAWCQPTTSDRVMDAALAEAFADILMREVSQPREPAPSPAAPHDILLIAGRRATTIREHLADWLRWLAAKLDPVPKSELFNCYIEPRIGGGTVFEFRPYGVGIVRLHGYRIEPGDGTVRKG